MGGHKVKAYPTKRITADDFSPYRVAEFWSKVRLTPAGCMLFGGQKNRYGYGVVEMRGRTSRSHRRCLAHRAAYAMTWGECPADKKLLHKCDTPACISPMCTFLGTQADNIADMAAKGRDRFYGRPSKGITQ